MWAKIPGKISGLRESLKPFGLKKATHIQQYHIKSEPRNFNSFEAKIQCVPMSGKSNLKQNRLLKSRWMWVNENQEQCVKMFYPEMEQRESSLKAQSKSSLTSRIAPTHWHAQISSWTACDPECPQVCSMSSMPAMPLSHHLEESMASSLMMTIKLMGTIPSLRVMFQNFVAH